MSEFFEGDLLATLVRLPEDYWDENRDLFFELSEIMVNVRCINSTIQNDILLFWERLDKTELLDNYTTDKKQIIKKYGLIFENGAWYSNKENSHKHLIFKDTFLQRHDTLGVLFRINKLCMAKVKYFRQNIDSFKPCKYACKEGFIQTDLWDSDFLKHKASGYILDYRYLQSITIYSDFVRLCEELESFNKQNQ